MVTSIFCVKSNWTFTILEMELGKCEITKARLRGTNDQKWRINVWTKNPKKVEVWHAYTYIFILQISRLRVQHKRRD